MQLSNRLTAVAEMVTPGSIVADVGCDHGYLSIYLVEKGIVSKAIAMDVNKGPLEKAKEHIQEYAFSKYIDTRLSDGAKALKDGEAHSLICAGMGGRLIIKILTESQEKVSVLREIILQPQSEVSFVRRSLREIGYSIEDENMILEEGKFYPIMRAIPKCIQEAELESITSQIYDNYGKLLLERKNSTLFQYLNLELTKYELILADLEKVQNTTSKQKARSLEIREKIKKIEQALLYFQEV